MPLTLKSSLKDDTSYIIIREYESGKIGASCVTEKRYGPRSGIKGESRSFKDFWIDSTRPEDVEHVDTHIVRLDFIVRKIMEKIKAEF